MKHRRRPKPERRRRQRRVRILHRNRLMPARLFRIYPDADAYPNAVVEVRFVRDAVGLVESNRQQGWTPEHGDYRCAGMVRTRVSRAQHRMVLHCGRVVAFMWLSRRDLHTRPGEITSHECGHAAMAWARWRCADLSRMPGEEVVCYALGRLVEQLNRVCYAAGAFA